MVATLAGCDFDDERLAELNAAFCVRLAAVFVETLLGVPRFFFLEAEDLAADCRREVFEGLVPLELFTSDFVDFFFVILRVAIDNLHTRPTTRAKLIARACPDFCSGLRRAADQAAFPLGNLFLTRCLSQNARKIKGARRTWGAGLRSARAW